MARERERGQTQPRGPALGPAMELGQTVVVEPDVRRLQQLARLGEAEPQIGLANLRELTGQAQSVEPELRVVARRQHDTELLRAARDEFRDLSRAEAARSSWRSSITSRIGRSRPASSAISLCTRPEPSNCGDGASGARTASDPTAARSCSSTESQKRWGSCSSRRTETQAARSARFASSIHECSSTVFPLPGGAETSVTPPANPADRRSNSSGRATTDGRCVPEVIEDPLTLRIVSRRNSPRKSKRPRKATSRATGVATATFAQPHLELTDLADRYDVGGHRSSDRDDAGSSARTRRSRHARSSDGCTVRDPYPRNPGSNGRWCLPGPPSPGESRRDGAHRPASGPGRTPRSPCSDRSARTRAHRNPASVASDGRRQDPAILGLRRLRRARRRSPLPLADTHAWPLRRVATRSRSGFRRTGPDLDRQ